MGRAVFRTRLDARTSWSDETMFRTTYNMDVFKWLVCLEDGNHFLTHGIRCLCRSSGIFCGSTALVTSIYDGTVSGAGGGVSNRGAKIPATGFSTSSVCSA